MRNQVGKAFSPEEKERLKAAAKDARSPAIYPALMLALNTGMRDSEIRGLQWERVDLRDAVLTVGASKTITWHEDSIEVLTRRAQNIDTLVETVWATT